MSAAAHEAFARVERLLADLSASPDPARTAPAQAIAAALLELHAEGLGRMMALAAAQGEAGRAWTEAVVADPLVTSLLLLHGVHPLGIEARVRAALDELATRLAAEGLRAVLVSADEGAVLVEMHAVNGSGPAHAHGDRSDSTARVARAVEEALLAAAPDAASIVVDGSALGAGAALIPVEKLVRKRRVAASDAERCDLCGVALEPHHDHLLDPARREITCACTPCAILFEPRGLAFGPARRVRVRHRVERLGGFRMTEAAWRELGIPIGLAYVCREGTRDAGSGAAGTSAGAGTSDAGTAAMAFYPSVAGVVATPIGQAAWDALAAENPVLAELAPDVEALLVNRMNGASEHYRVSIDECFRLAGVVRRSATHLAPGPEISPEIERFFAALQQAS